MAVLFQQFEQYPFTARESIGYGDIDRVNDLEGIKEAAKKVNIDSCLKSNGRCLSLHLSNAFLISSVYLT
jgi:hypothetical protein